MAYVLLFARESLYIPSLTHSLWLYARTCERVLNLDYALAQTSDSLSLSLLSHALFVFTPFGFVYARNYGNTRISRREVEYVYRFDVGPIMCLDVGSFHAQKSPPSFAYIYSLSPSTSLLFLYLFKFPLFASSIMSGHGRACTSSFAIYG